MKASELRIGNWVEIPQDAIDAMWHQCGEKCEKYHQVTGLKKYAHLSDDIKFPYEDLLPIPLTEDWLVKFGFELEHKEGNQGSFRVYRKGELVYNSNHKAFWYNGQILKNAPLDYIHQIQNLFYNVEGQELEIKDNAPT